MFVPLSRRHILSRDPRYSLRCLPIAIVRTNGSRNRYLHIQGSHLFSSTKLTNEGKSSDGAAVIDTPKLAKPGIESTGGKKAHRRTQQREKAKLLLKAAEQKSSKRLAQDGSSGKPFGQPEKFNRKGKTKAVAKKGKKALAKSVTPSEDAEEADTSTTVSKKSITEKPRRKPKKISLSSGVEVDENIKDSAAVIKEDAEEAVSPKPKSKSKMGPKVRKGPRKTVKSETPRKGDNIFRKILGVRETNVKRRPSSEGDVLQVIEPEKSAEQLAHELRNLQHVQGLVQLVEGGKLSGNAKSAVLKALRGALSSGSSIFQKTSQASSAESPRNGDGTTTDQVYDVQQRVLAIKKHLAQITKPVKTASMDISSNVGVRYIGKPGTDISGGEVFDRDAAVAAARDRNMEAEAAATDLAEDDLPHMMRNHEVKTIKARSIELTPIDNGDLEVPPLAYGLERVLFNPGVYQLQDPRTHVFNFDPYLQTIMPVNEFDFSALKEYITSSRDNDLLGRAKMENKRYTGSTSSMSSALAHFHFLLSQWRPINTGNLTKQFPVELQTFTSLQRAPVAIFLRWLDGAYAIDADKEFDTTHILMELGKSMEKLLTNTTASFERYRKGNSHQVTNEERYAPEAFHYSTLGDFLLRSQLDAHDPRLPGTGMFDLKTRAVVSIRMNAAQYEDSKGYEITDRHGEWSSYEREYYDMIRAAFLKYSMQVRMGRMDGIFVAFHNTERIFGFQYISLQEMDYCIHGTDDLATGDGEFKLSISLLNQVLDKATAKFPGKTLRLHFETRPAITPFMYIFAEPFEEEQVEEIQNSKKEQLEKFRRDILGVGPDTAEWAKLEENVDETMAIDEIDPEGLSEDAEGEKTSDELENANEEAEEGDETSAALAGDDGNEGVDEDVEEEEEEGAGEEEEEEQDEENDEEDTDEEKNEEEEEVEESEKDDNNEGDEEHIEDTAEVEESTKIDGENLATESHATEPNESFKPDDAVESDDVVYEDGKGVEDSGDSATDEASPTPQPPDHGFLAMSLTIRNKVNGAYVTRPEELSKSDDWEVEYSLREIEDPVQATTLYDGVKARRKRMMTNDFDISRKNARQDAFLKNLKEQIERGKKYRSRIDRAQKDKPVKILTVETVPASSVDSPAPGEEKSTIVEEQ